MSGKELRPFLNQLRDGYHRKEFLNSDPLEFVHRYPDPWDQEAVALIAALLAYGNVKQIRRSVADALKRMEAEAGSPSAYVRALHQKQEGTPDRAFQGFVHRFNRGEDLVLLLGLLAKSWNQHGSLGAHFTSYLSPQDRTFEFALDQLIAEWRLWAGGRAGTSFSYLLTAPKDGSCCKRWCMFLRWMGRKDELDPGLWTREGALSKTFASGRFLRPDQLVIPIDTHTGRLSQFMGLTHRKSLNWKAANEITDALRSCDSADPVSYDFALARMGILDLCRGKFVSEICTKCGLFPVCQFAQRRSRRQKKSSVS